MGMVTTTLDLQYDRARRKIRDGDLLLFRRQRGRLGGKLISTAGRSEYDHAAMAAWWNRRLIPRLIARMRAWDVATAGRPHRYAAISRHVAGRIRQLGVAVKVSA